MTFDAKIVVPLQAHLHQRQHLPLLLTPQGAARVTTALLEELSLRTGHHLRFVADSRYARDGLSGCMLVGFEGDASRLLQESWLYAEYAHQTFLFDVDVLFGNWIPSQLNDMGKSTTTVHRQN